jgi:hypothetical protein
MALQVELTPEGIRQDAQAGFEVQACSIRAQRAGPVVRWKQLM